MHGTLDERFPIESVEENYGYAPGPKDIWILEGVTHGIDNGGGPEAGLREYFSRMTTFLEEKAPNCLTNSTE